MKLAVICGSFNPAFARGELVLVGFVARASAMPGVTGVEFQDIHFPQTRPAYLRALSQAAADRGLAVVGIGIHNDFGRADEHLRQSELVKVKQWIEVAESLGAGHVRVFAGWPEGSARERWPAMIAALREAAGFAASAGVRLALENEAAFTPSATEHLGIVDEVGSPALGLLLDPGNYSAGWPSVLRAAPRAIHVHAKFWRVGPDGGEPGMDYPSLLAVLRQSGYRGYLTYEYEAADDPDALHRAYQYLRRVVAAA